MRIVSFLAAGTEIVNAIGAGDQLLGRSHECDYPPGVDRLPIVSRPALELGGLSQAEIDSAIAGHMQTGESLYVVDEELLRKLAPDVILTQELCHVCAPSGNELTRALATLPKKPELVFLTPRTLAEIDENILTVGRVVGRQKAAQAVVDRNHATLERVRASTNGRARRRVTFLEWADPPFCAGHWVPEMLEIAGGHDPLGRPGADSVRVTWDDIRETRPEIVIVAPCGFGLRDAQRMACELPELPGARIEPVDANAYFARPGPRYAEGVEVLARLFQS
jgi:iron complex transport system substrate-binding protein